MIFDFVNPREAERAFLPLFWAVCLLFGAFFLAGVVHLLLEVFEQAGGPASEPSAGLRS